MDKNFKLNLPKVTLVELPGEEELFINGESVCCHNHLYPSDVLDALDKSGIIEFNRRESKW